MALTSEAGILNPTAMTSNNVESRALPWLVWLSLILLTLLSIEELNAPKPVAGTAPLDQFSAERALNCVRRISISPHPIGSDNSADVREYLLTQLSELGLEPHSTELIGISNKYGRLVLAKTRNIVARLPGAGGAQAVMLVAHYDSTHRSPGAADDGAAVAAILETIRALKVGSPLKNDILVLLTDGEEAGMLGADAFANADPLMKNVGLILNFEARGSRGPSLLFETSPHNRALISAVGAAAPYPIGSSLFYSLYKLLPNDTDFTVFRRQDIPGLNFAFGENLEVYHSSLDTVHNLSAASLQHHGSYALSLTRYFGGLDLARLHDAAGDDIFFNILGAQFVSYRQEWTLDGHVFATFLLVCLVLMEIRSRSLRFQQIAFALLFSTATLIVIPVISGILGWLLFVGLGNHRIWSDSSANLALLMGFACLDICVGIVCSAYALRRLPAQAYMLSGLIIAVVLSWLNVLILPAGSYLLFWPCLFVIAGLLVAKLVSPKTIPSATTQAIAGFPGMVMAILLFAPLVYLLYVFLTLQLVVIIALGIIVGLLFLICIASFAGAMHEWKWRPAALGFLVVAAVCTVAGVILSHSSNEHPDYDTVLYSFNSDTGTAKWISYDSSVDEWTKQFFANPSISPRPLPELLEGNSQPVLSSPAPVFPLAAPIAHTISYQKGPEKQKIVLAVQSARSAGELVITFDPGIRPEVMQVGDRQVVPLEGKARFKIVLLGFQDSAAALQLTFDEKSSIAFWLSDQSLGLPSPSLPRPANLIAGEGSDETMVSRRYSSLP